MEKYLIVWTHRHGTNTHIIETERDFGCMSDDTAWDILKELGYGVEPEQEDFIEMFENIRDITPEFLPKEPDENNNH